jgi:zinc protease
MRNPRIFAFLLLTLPAFAQTLPKGITPVTTVEGITEYRLENGLRVLLFPDPSKPTVTVNVTYLVGSRHESYGETGMAHLLEHMVFKGTDRHPDIWASLTAHGAQFNGSTDWDRTNYFEVLQASDENLQWALDMEADRMVNSHIAKKDLDKEMTVVRNEFESGENNPGRILMQRTMAAAFEWHNYGKTTIGARSDIENVPIENLQAFYRKYYQPDDAMLVVAGKFDTPKTLNWIAQYFAVIPKPARVLPKIYTLEPTQDGERTVTVRRVGDVQAIDILYHSPAGSHPDDAADDVLMSILGDAPSGRLYKALVDNKKAASVSAFNMGLAEAGMLMFTAQVRKEQSLDAAKDAMLNVIESFVKEPPSAEEVERAKTKILKNVDLALSNSSMVGVTLSEPAALGDWRLLFLGRDAVKKVTRDDVVRVAKTYLKESNRTIGMFIPTAAPDRSEIPAMPDVAKEVKDYKSTEVRAEGEVFDVSPANIDARTVRATLPNGAKVALLSKKTRGATVQASITLRFGTEKSVFGKAPVAVLAGQMLNRGTRNHSRQQIQDEFDKLKARVNFSGGPTNASVNIQTVHENLPATLKLVAEVLREATFPDSEFDQIKTANIARNESQKSEPQALAQMELMRHLYPFPKGDVRATNTPDEDVADLKAASLAEVKQFYQDFYGASKSEFAVVGDFDATEIQKLLGTLFGDWKSPKPYERVTRPYAKIAPMEKRIETPDKANAMFMAGLRLPISDEDADYPALEIANFLLGGSANSRLLNRLRQKEGWSYGAGSQFRPGTKENNGVLLGYAILAPQNIVKLEAGFKEEFDKILKTGFTPEEVEAAKKAWQQEENVQRSNDGALVRGLSSNLFFDRTMAFDAAIEKKVAALTADQVNAAFRKHIDPAQFTILKAGDFKKAGIPE